MDLRNLDPDLTAAERINQRRIRIEDSLGLDLALLQENSDTIGEADTKNCEQMFGQIPMPVGLAGPLHLCFSDKKTRDVYLPLATTEGALVASINRGCKVITEAGGVSVRSMYHGMSRSLCFGKNYELGIKNDEWKKIIAVISKREKVWKKIGESTSRHLKIMDYDIETKDEYLFLTIACYTDEAMGMNMVTIAAQAIGEWIQEHIEGLRFLTVAGNVDSDKKPSLRTHDKGRGYEVTADAMIPMKAIQDILKSDAKTMQEVAHAKLSIGSKLAGAIGKNLHAANIVAALYLATGQDAAHVVEGSLADTTVKMTKAGLHISIRLPAILVGIRGGGTTLPSQAKALEIILKEKTSLHPCRQLSETIGAAVLAGELSLLAAQAGHTLASAHRKHARK